jgi:hypothetical protein
MTTLSAKENWNGKILENDTQQKDIIKMTLNMKAECHNAK